MSDPNTSSTEKAQVVHWGNVNERPTSLHGNGAASFAHTTLDPAKVTCRLCTYLLLAERGRR